MVRISKEYVFNLVELVGRAVTTARKKTPGPEWDMDGQIEILMRRWSIKPDHIDEIVAREAREEEDHRNLFEESSWKDSANDGVDGAIDERENRRSWSPWGSDKFEQRKARRAHREFGDAASCKLWKLQRQLAFGDIKVIDALKELQEFCATELRGFISAGWGNRLRAIIDDSCRGK